MANWKELAAKAKKDGYLAGGPWEVRRLGYLQQFQPELATELEEEGKGTLLAHVQSEVWDAEKLQSRLMDEGTPTQAAEEMALLQLFPEQN